MDFIMNENIGTMKVLLINPPIATPISTPQEKGPFSDIGENLGLGVIGSALKEKGIYYKIVDCCLMDISLKNIITIIEDECIDFIGISVPSLAAYPTAKEFALLFKSSFPNLHIILGGHYASIDYELILKNCPVDFIIVGDGEIIFPQLIKCIKENENLECIKNIVFLKNGKVLKTPSGSKISVNKTVLPDRSTLPLVLEKGGFASLNTSKGCNGGCIFCSTVSYSKSAGYAMWSGKSPIVVYNEILDLVNNHNTNNFIIIDDCFLGVNKGSRSRSIKIAKLISENRIDVRYLIMCNPEEIASDVLALLHKSGLRAVSIGIESGDDSALKRLGRKMDVDKISGALNILKTMDIEMFLGIIPFDPESTIGEIENTISFLYNHSILNISSFRKRLMIMPGTQIEMQLRKENRLLKSGGYTISDHKTNMLVNVLEEALKPLGAQLNNLFYVKKWDKAIERDTQKYSQKTRVLREADTIINEESFQILYDTVNKVLNCSDNQRELGLITNSAVGKIEKLYKSITCKLS